MDVGNICIGIAISAFSLIAWRMATWCRHMTEAEDRYRHAQDKLVRWHEARPFLKVAVCMYSRALVIEMISAYKELLELGAVSDINHYEELKALLNDWPSPYSPQTYNPAVGGVCLFCMLE